MLHSITKAAAGGFLLLVVADATAADRSGKAAADKTNVARDVVTKALLAESRGENEERSRLLRSAWQSHPESPDVNWHLVRVRAGQEWVPLTQVTSQAASDPNLAKYRQIREKAASPKALHDLAHWCDKQGWHDRARLHYAQVLADARSDAAADRKSDV